MSVRSAPDSPLVTSLAKRQKTNNRGNSFFTEPTIKVQVKGKTNNRPGWHTSRAPRTWYLHRAPLMDESPVFHQRFSGATNYGSNNNVLSLENTSAETVDAFSQWLYTKTLQIPELRLDLPYPEEIDSLPNSDTLSDDDHNSDAGNDVVVGEPGEEVEEDDDKHIEGGMIDVHSSHVFLVGGSSIVGQNPADGGGDRDVTIGRDSPAPSRQSWGSSMKPSPYQSSSSSSSSSPSRRLATDEFWARLPAAGTKGATSATSSSHEQDTAAATAVTAAAVLPIAHPFDRVTARLLDLYIFAQTYDVPILQADVLDLWKRFRDYHRGDRPHHNLEVLRRACAHLLTLRPSPWRDPPYTYNDDPLWAWLTADFVKALEFNEKSIVAPSTPAANKAVPALAVLEEMWHEGHQTLPPAFWAAVFKGKIAADARLLSEYHKRLHDQAQESAVTISRLDAQAQADRETIERLQRLNTPAEADREMIEYLQKLRREDAEEIDDLYLEIADGAHDFDKTQYESLELDEQIFHLRNQAMADRDTIVDLRAQAKDDASKIQGLEAQNHDSVAEVERLQRRIRESDEAHQQVLNEEKERGSDRVVKYREVIRSLHDEHAAEIERLGAQLRAAREEREPLVPFVSNADVIAEAYATLSGSWGPGYENGGAQPCQHAQDEPEGVIDCADESDGLEDYQVSDDEEEE